MDLEKRIEACRERALRWFAGNMVAGQPPEIKRCSSAHDPAAYPGMLLPATYNSVHCLRLLGAYDGNETEARRRAAGFINRFQTDSGAYRIPEMKDDEVHKRDNKAYTWEYLDFHVTNYALGAVLALGEAPPRPLEFMNAYLSREGFERWVSRRRMDDPWMEGNNIVNLGGFYIYLRGLGDEEAASRLVDLFGWLEAEQDDETGFWGESFSRRTDLLVGMAGAMHVFHLFFHEGRTLPRFDRITEHCLSLLERELAGVTSACLDVDIVDALANAYRLGIRRGEIERSFEKKLAALLGAQNPDGGFPDLREGTRTFDGWPRGYSEPQGFSNCFATWFRCAAIGMISCVLFPDTADNWNFRNTVGIGYFKKEEWV